MKNVKAKIKQFISMLLGRGLTVKVKPTHSGAQLPIYATEGAACFDLHAHRIIDATEKTKTIGTGLSFEVPKDNVMLVFSRSGHGFKGNVRLANCVGVIDEDYRGEVMVKMTKDQEGEWPSLHKGERVAQAMILPVKQVRFVLAKTLSETERGDGGFGHTDQKTA